MFAKIKKHKYESAVHRQAEEIELAESSGTQPTWTQTRSKQISKQQQAVQNIMFACIHICQQDQSLNSLEPLCMLFEQLNIQMIPSASSMVNYRNNDAALCFLQHIGGYLHEELIEKVKASPVLGISIFSILIPFHVILIFLLRMDDGRVNIQNNRKKLRGVCSIPRQLSTEDILLWSP